MKKPSVKGMSNMGYLGHFANDKWLEKGHNDVGDARKMSGLDSETGEHPLVTKARKNGQIQWMEFTNEIDRMNAEYHSKQNKSKKSKSK